MHGSRRYAVSTLTLTLGAAVATAGLLAPGAGGARAATARPAETGTAQQLTLAVSPDTPHQGSTVTLSASNIPSQGASLPQSITASLAGFSTDTTRGVADSAAVLCTAAEASAQTCPAASKVGSGTAVITVTPQPAYAAFNPGPIDATIASYLEAPTQAGAAADVAITFSTQYGDQTVQGHLDSTTAGLTLSVPDLSNLDSQFAMYQSYIQSADLQSLSLTLGRHRTISTVTARRVREKVSEKIRTRVHEGHKIVIVSVTRRVEKTVVKRTTTRSEADLVVNPAACTSAGWTGALTVGDASGPTTLSATAPCED